MDTTDDSKVVEEIVITAIKLELQLKLHLMWRRRQLENQDNMVKDKLQDMTICPFFEKQS